ncbi:MAG: hypothetical protein ACP5NZ_00540 [Nanobdellota archaeon]
MKTEEYNITSLNGYLSFLEAIAKGIKEEKGYAVAGHMGVRVSKNKKHPCKMFGILKEKAPIEKRILGFKYNEPQRADLLGEFWEEDNKFNLNIYGQDNYLETMGLIKKYSPHNKINLDKFVFQDKREEAYLSDLVA